VGDQLAGGALLLEMRNERGGPRLHGQVVMGLFATQAGQIRVASNSNQWKMKGLENPSHCSHCSHFSHRDGEGAGGAAPVWDLWSLFVEATVDYHGGGISPPPPCLEMRNWKIEKRKAQIQNRKGFRPLPRPRTSRSVVPVPARL
jgi:hypothetical protein